MIRRFALLLPVLALAGCGSDAATEPEPLQLAADLVAVPAEVPAEGTVGEVVQYQLPMHNAGNARVTPGWYARAWLSTDHALDAGDALVDQFAARHDLNPGGNDSYLRTFKVPADVAPGDYHIVSELDATGMLAEPSEENNTAASGATIRIVGPGL